MQITEREAIRRHRKQFRVSRIIQWLHGSTTICSELHLRPCARCHGNDQTVLIREAPGFALVRCERCGRDYLT